MAVRRRRMAWALLLILLIGLGWACFASAIGHDCAGEISACPLCLYLSGKLHQALLPLLLAVLVAQGFALLVYRLALPARHSFYLSFVFPGVHMND